MVRRIGLGAACPSAADRGIGHGLAQLFQQRLIPAIGLHQLDRLLTARPAGRALATAFILEEPQHVERRGLGAVLIRQAPPPPPSR